jgi:GNAT superfamily N-acetyltransferase
LNEPRRIAAGDPVGEFDCGVASLDDWLARRALRNEERGDSRTYVVIDAATSRIAGYYSLASWSVARKQAGGWLARNAPETVSVILLGRLAVDQAAQGAGLGGDLVTHAVRNVTIAANVVGARALVAEAIDEAAAQFYRLFGFEGVGAGWGRV